MPLQKEEIEKLKLLIENLQISQLFQELDKLKIVEVKLTMLKNDFICGVKDSNFFDRLKAYVDSLGYDKEIINHENSIDEKFISNLNHSNVNVNTIINNIEDETNREIKKAKQILMGAYIKNQQSISFYQGIERQLFLVLNNTVLDIDFIKNYNNSLNSSFESKISEINNLYNYVNNYIQNKNNQSLSQDAINMKNILSNCRNKMGLFEIDEYTTKLIEEKNKIIKEEKLDTKMSIVSQVAYGIQIIVTAYFNAPEMGWLKAIGFGFIAPFYWIYYSFLWKMVIQPIINYFS